MLGLIESFRIEWHPDAWTWVHLYHGVWLFTHGRKTGFWLGIMLPLWVEITQGLVPMSRDPQSFFDPSDLLVSWGIVTFLYLWRKR